MSDRPKFNPRGSLETVLNVARDNRTRLLAANIYAINLAFNLIHQGQPLAVSAMHGIANMANAGLFSPDWHQFVDVWDFVGLGSQTGMYIAAGVLAANVLGGIGIREFQKMQGELPINIHDGIILADYGKGIPFFTHLGKTLAGKDDQLQNVVLARVTEEAPTRNADEKKLFSKWAANMGSVSEAWLDSSYWERAGAKEAKAIVINTNSTDESLLAASVIRSQVENTIGQIIVIDTDPDFSHTPDTLNLNIITDKSTNSTLINPFFEIASHVVQGLKGKNALMFMPHDGKKREEKQDIITSKLKQIGDKPTIYLDGITENGEGKGLAKALSFFNDDVTVTNDPSKANIVLHFGSGDITNDVDALLESKTENIPESALSLSVVFHADNEDTGLEHHDGAVSIQQAVNSKVIELIEPHVKKSTPLWNRIKKVGRKK